MDLLLLLQGRDAGVGSRLRLLARMQGPLLGTKGKEMNALERRLQEVEARNAADRARYADRDPDLCMLCQVRGPDKRALFIDCWYAIHEVVPEAIRLAGVRPEPRRGQGYYLNLCKGCRGRLLGHLKQWREECVALRGENLDTDGNLEAYKADPAREIPVRQNGAIVYLTRAEWDALNPGRVPVIPRRGEE